MKHIRNLFALITGSTDGIGKLTALRLAQMGAGVLLHGRDPEKCRSVRDEIWEASGNPRLEYFVADFSSLPDVRHMATSIIESYDRLDILINNAGVFPASSENDKRFLSAQGHDLCFAVNYLAPFLLTHLLLPCLRTAETARVVNVVSVAQESIDFENVMLMNNYSPMRAYAQSKLALTMFTFEMHDRLKKENIRINCLHPGSLLDTKMVREALSEPLGSAESGAEAAVHLATSPDVEDVSGAYYEVKEPAKAHSQAYDQQARQKLWQLSLGLTDLAAPSNG